MAFEICPYCKLKLDKKDEATGKHGRTPREREAHVTKCYTIKQNREFNERMGRKKYSD